MEPYRPGSEVAGRFEILDHVGEGGMGAVFKAKQISLDRIVALKVLHSQVAFTPRARRRFGREARAVARLNHPHIASVFDFGTDNDEQSLWLAMEFVDGVGMTGMKRSEIDVVRLLSTFDQILSALSAAHARGIIHRDLKPSNILLTRNDEGQEVIKLVDFGLAATQEGELSLDGAPGGLNDEEDVGARVIMGTPRYMAPEIFRRQPVDPRVDLYALGVILFEILAGEPPYPGDDPKQIMRGHLRGPIPQLRVRNGVTIPTELERCIYKLLAKDPSDRYQTANDVRDALMMVLGEFSYVPWAMGPSIGDVSQFARGNISKPGFLSGFGGQTIPPAAMMGPTASRIGSLGSTAPLVGRDTERRLIEKKISQTVKGQVGGMVFIDGESGIGKTRLAQWVQVRVDESGVMRSARGQFTNQRAGFDGIRTVLDSLLNTNDLTYDEVEYAIRNRLMRWDFSVGEIETCIDLMRPGGEAALFEGIAPGEENRVSKRERVFAMVERILRQVAQTRPLMVILEDLHLASDNTFAFLEHIAVGLHLNPAPILVFGTIRTEDIEAVPEIRDSLQRLGRFGTEVTRIKLDRLTDEESKLLVEKMLPVDEALARKISTRSAGNALHLVQILRYLQETEKLSYQNGEWALAPGVDLAGELPRELVDIMRSRAEQVLRAYPKPDVMREVLVRCAILGTQFDYRLLRGFFEAEGGEWESYLDEVLEYLVKNSLLREVGHSAEDKLEFHHAVMRDVLLDDFDVDRRLRDLHRLAAEVKVAFHGNRVREHALEIAEHYRRARDPHGVYVFTVKAARAALSTSDLGEAISLYRKAKELAELEVSIDEPGSLDGLGESSAVLQSAEVALEVAHLELRLGEYDSARQHYRGLLRNGSKNVAVWARWGLGALALEQGELEEAIGWFEATQREGQTLDRDGGNHVAAWSLYGIGRIEALRGELSSAAKTLVDSLERAQKIQIRNLEGEVLRVLADVVWSLGDDDRAEVYRRRATILAESMEDREALAHSTFHAARHHRRTGRPDRAMELLSGARQMYEAIGKRHQLAHCLLEEGMLDLGREDYKNAASQLREALRFYEAFDDRRGMTQSKAALANLALAIGKRREAKTFIDDAVDGFRTMGDRLGKAYCALFTGELAISLGQPKSVVFEKLAVEFETLGDRRGVVLSNAFLAYVEIFEGNVDGAKKLIESALEEMQEMPIVDPSLARLLDRLSAAFNERDPELAVDIDAVAELTWRRLGRNVRVRA